MCIIMVKYKGIKLPNEDIFSACWQSNSHGAGFMYSENNVLHVEKGFMKEGQLMKRLRDFRDFDGNLVVHWRIASHGAVNKKNCHPWMIGSNMAMVHNGIISKLATDRDESDSKKFAAMLGSFDVMNNSHHRDALEAFISSGYSNKVVIMDRKGSLCFLNKQAGVEDKATGCWFSNHGYIPRNLNNYMAPIIKSNSKYTFEDIDGWVAKHMKNGIQYTSTLTGEVYFVSNNGDSFFEG